MRTRKGKTAVLAVLALLTSLVTAATVPSSATASAYDVPNINNGRQPTELSSVLVLEIQATGTTSAVMNYNRTTHRLSGTASTVGWSRGTIRIVGQLRGPDSALIYSRENTCSNSTSCTLPTWSRRPIQQGTYEWWVRGSGPGGSDIDVDHLGVFW